MTSTNVVEFEIRDRDHQTVGRIRQNVLCKLRWEELSKYTPVSDHTIITWWFDEDDERHYQSKQNLEKFLAGDKPKETK